MLGVPPEWLDKVEKNSSRFYKLMKGCLNIKKEDVVVISDYGLKGRHLSTLMGYGYYYAAKEKSFRVELLFQDVKKGFMQADPQVIKTLERLHKESVIILAVANKLGRLGSEKSFRTFCQEKGYRFISMTGLGDVHTSNFDLFMEAMSVNYSRMKKNGLFLKKKWDKAEEIRVKTEAGTDLTFNVAGMEAIANIGEYHEKGTGGNIPAGEVYIPPKGYLGVNGKVVVDGSMRTETGTVLLNEPVTLTVEKGKVVKIEGKMAHLLEKTLSTYEDRAKYPERVRLISELSIGINPGAVLIGSAVMDEKVLGTGHIGIGSNYWFGGAIRTVHHGNHVFKSPTFYVDGKKMEI